MKLEHLTNETFKEKVFNYEASKEWKFEGEIPAIIDFYADWCGPCKLLSPTMKELSEENSGRIKIAQSDIESNHELVKKFSIANVPSILLFKGGELVDRHVGLRSKKDLQHDIEGVCNA